MAESSTAPSTPAVAKDTTTSSSPPRSSSVSTPATSTEKPKRSSASSPQEQDTMQIEPSSELEIMEMDSNQDGQVETATKGKKRKASTTSKPVAKKSKTSSSSSNTNAKASSSKLKSTTTTTSSTSSVNPSINVSNELVSFKDGKLQHKQKNGPKSDVVTSYLIGRAAFIEWAVEFFKTSTSNDKLPEIPTEHLGAIAKDVQEASQLLSGLARFIRNNLASSVTENMSALEDSQDQDLEGAETSDEKEKKEKVLDRIDLEQLKKTIETLAVRTNYGLAVEDLKDGELPNGVSSIPTSLQYWVWEVQDLKLLSNELVPKFEKRRTEREEIKRSVIELYQSLSEEDQLNLLLSSKKGSNNTETSSSKKKDVKGKGKAKDEGDVENDGDSETTATEKKKPKTSGGKKKKELTEEEKAEKEEKQRIKAEKEAEKEAARLKREADKSAKAAKDAIEAEKKAAKKREKEEKKQLEEKKLAAKQAALKSQKNLMSSFFKTSPTPSTIATAGTTSSVAASTSGTPKANKDGSPGVIASSPATSKGQLVGDFAKVFHPFTIRPGVKVAPINRFNKKEKKTVSVQIDSDSSITLKDSLASFVSGVPKRRIPPYNPYPTPQFSVRDLVVGINDSTLTSQDASGFYEILKDREKVPVKLLKFREDVRPGYVGTWSKISKVVTPRTPFCRDGAVLNYEHDSEGEWEEEPDDAEAENVGSDAEMSADENEGDASEVDSWLAEDDEILYESGYEEDGDIVMMDADASRRPHRDLGDDDDDDDIIVVEGEQEKKERLKREKEKKRRIEEKQKKKKTNGPLLALVKGPVWEDQDGVSKEPAFKGMKIRFLNDSSYGINPFTFVSVPPQQAPAPVPVAVASTTQPGKGKENVAVGASTSSTAIATNGPDKDSNKKPVSSKASKFPETLLKDFLSEINGSDRSQVVIVDEFVRTMKEHKLTKAACLAKWKEIGIKKMKGKMVVPDALLVQHGLR